MGICRGWTQRLDWWAVDVLRKMMNGRVDRGRAKDQPFQKDAFEASASNALLCALFDLGEQFLQHGAHLASIQFRVSCLHKFHGIETITAASILGRFK